MEAHFSGSPRSKRTARLSDSKLPLETFPSLQRSYCRELASPVFFSSGALDVRSKSAGLQCYGDAEHLQVL